MSISPALTALRKYTLDGAPIPLTKEDAVVDSIAEADSVLLDNVHYLLSQATGIVVDDKDQTLRLVLLCWIHDKSSILDYKNACQAIDVPDFKFLAKTELNMWLAGSQDTCALLEGLAPVPAQNYVNETSLEDPRLGRIALYERELVDHNAALRGSKAIEFNHLVSDARRLVTSLKRPNPSKTKSLRPGSANGSGPAHSHKQPIIIVSPATTALLSLANIKLFLEDGVFVEPLASHRSQQDLVMLSHPSDRLAPAAQRIMVVDNVEKFSKPEYWDRVVAIFTTGQEWQFAKYKYLNPRQLFLTYPGFYVSYAGDPTPPKIKEWNVAEIKVDRGDTRFRDKVIVRDFWLEMDKILIARGYGRQ